MFRVQVLQQDDSLVLVSIPPFVGALGINRVSIVMSSMITFTNSRRSIDPEASTIICIVCLRVESWIKFNFFPVKQLLRVSVISYSLVNCKLYLLLQRQSLCCGYIVIRVHYIYWSTHSSLFFTYIRFNTIVFKNWFNVTSWEIVYNFGSSNGMFKDN